MVEVKGEDVADDNASGQAHGELAGDVTKARRPGEHRAGDAVDRLCAELLRAGDGNKRRPLGLDPTMRIGLQHRALEHALGARVEAGRLEIDDRETKVVDSRWRAFLDVPGRQRCRDHHDGECRWRGYRDRDLSPENAASRAKE